MTGLRDALRELPEAVFADVLERDDAYLVVLDLPGATAETVDIDVETGKLVIEARREKDVSREYRFLSEERSLFLDIELPLPPNAMAQEATASLNRGVLELEIPKQAAGEETSIPVTEA